MILSKKNRIVKHRYHNLEKKELIGLNNRYICTDYLLLELQNSNTLNKNLI